MDNSIYSISPIDGRYFKITECLRKYFSEFALFKYRLMFEVKYLLFLKKMGLPEFKTLSRRLIHLLKIYIKISLIIVVVKLKILNLLLIMMLKRLNIFLVNNYNIWVLVNLNHLFILV